MWSETELEGSDVYGYLHKRFNGPNVIRRSGHRYRVGSPGEFYSDFDLLLNDPYNCRYVTAAYAQEIEEISKEYAIDLLGFVEKSDGGSVGAVRLAGALSIYTGIPNITVRLGRELEFEQVKTSRLEGEFAGKPQKAWLSGALVVVITDNTSSGGEAEKAVKAVEYNGGRVKDIITYTLREWKPPATERFEKRTPPIKLHTIWNLPEDIPERRRVEIGISQRT